MECREGLILASLRIVSGMLNGGVLGKAADTCEIVSLRYSRSCRIEAGDALLTRSVFRRDG